MRRSNHTDAEIMSLLREAEQGVPIKHICATAYVSVRTFYRWRKQLGGLQPDAIRRLRTLEMENQHLRVLVGQLKGSNPDGVWSGWKQGDGSVARSECGLPGAVACDAAMAPAAGCHRGSGASSGRFASLRAGRC
ncbi:transposase [Aurantimonas aggregata]|uniref:Transposase n=1 Tax=Aurantimonas aggregata TaxID=2047720 RepID=A0A6L9MK16_9HYPH|nr:transposase [Aurantimonas aggregata]NDV87938.1 transposase [Aurantimonas aggregata]